ncbi:hypothetical protein [Sphaerimonospora thailandensis]|uniref:Uncharacterized protein n=1 Tax=Sphaerimonospora thailandensis TaxID=795644 RepID=A0A8J3R7K8_9ACTN|nr:hypothetical protein [Sphaerimonospora thailandensis]GIH69479.1 hypothetical protein Mth01_17320 [Sphaerimonospora thailandensis]
MIVEDEYGRDVDPREMDDDREPEAPELEGEPPVDLGVLTDIHARHLVEGASAEGKEAAQILLEYMPALIAELRQARAELEAWHGRDHRHEYALTPDGDKPGPYSGVNRSIAERAAGDRPDLGTPWERTISTSQWTRYEPSPF